MLDIVTATDEGCKDHVDVVFNAEAEIVLVLLGQSREINVSLGEIDAFAGRDLAIVNAADFESLLVGDLQDFESEDAVVDKNGAALFNDLGDVLIVDVPR